MEDKYVIFDILGVKHTDGRSSLKFEKNAECIINNDPFINKIVVSSDISQVTFFLHKSLKILDDEITCIIDYLTLYLSNMMVSLLRYSSPYSSVLLKPTIRLSIEHLATKNNITTYDTFQICDSISMNYTFSGNEILKKWVQDIEISNYTSRSDKYDILFLLLQGENIVQKYMAMYAYLMSLVQEIYSKPRESQKNVVRYVSENCSRVEIKLIKSPSTRPGAKSTEEEDQFTSLRNKIGHPSGPNKHVNINENIINQLASIICCAIEDIPL